MFRLLIFVTLVGVGCQPEPQENAQVRPKPSGQPKALPLDKFPTAKVKVPISQIREAPDITSKQIADLKKGEALALLGPVSDQATKLTIEGQTFIQPWLRVRKTNGTEGWVHAAVLDGELPENIMLKAFLGKDLAGATASYYQAYAEMSDAKSVLQVLQQAHELCNALTLALQIQPPEVAPEVAAILPALTVVWLESDRSWRFFIDYKDFANAAERSTEPIDNEMLKLYYAVYPVDSIGYPYPAWV
ncbi:MAG: SH3 domain-containing protein, partial [Mameliella sp.]|nr:SH3 domain-containing protein [Phaeodactylibacter sp.]